LCNSWRGCVVFVSIYAEQWSATYLDMTSNGEEAWCKD
jgi:hypothetical protein